VTTPAASCQCSQQFWLIIELLREQRTLLEKILTEQASVDADAAAIEADVVQENTALAAIEAEVAALKAANPALDFTALDKAVADAGTAAAAEVAAAPPAPPVA
jgi:hypothetical protein